MKKIRINVLARELEVKSHLILELLPDLGVSEKLTHSSSIDEDVADKLRVRFGIEPIGNGDEPSTAQIDGDRHGQEADREEPPATVEEPERREPEPREAVKVSPSVEAAPPPSTPETEAEQLAPEPPVRPSPPIRPPIASPGPPAPARPAVVPARPLPMAPRPGQILSPPPAQPG